MAIDFDMGLVRCNVEIYDNQISDSSQGIRLDCEIGAYYFNNAEPEHASNVVINNNTINHAEVLNSDGDDGAIVARTLFYGSVQIIENELVDCRKGIVMMHGGRAGAKTDVQLLDNRITLSDSAPAWEYESAIYLDMPEKVTRVEGNTIKGSTDHSYEYGIFLGDIGYYGPEFEAYVLDNEVSHCDTGLSIYALYLNDEESSLYVNGNEFTDNQYGVFFEDEANEDNRAYYFFEYLEIKDNIFKDNTITGLFLNASDYKFPAAVLIEANLFESNGYEGLILVPVMEAEDSEILILANMFKDNQEYGLLIEGEGSKVKVYLNAFTGNGAGLVYGGETPLDAAFNWWGSAAGPTVRIFGYTVAGLSEENDNTTGDIAAMADEGMIRFDPWLAALDLTPAAATVRVNRTHTLTAALRDNQGNLVDLAGLALAIGVAGAHNLDGYETLNAGSFDWGYEGTAMGEDTVTAAVLFAGQGAGLEAAAAVTWERAAVEGDEDEDEKSPKDELPKTEGALPWPLLGGALLLAGFCLVIKERILVRHK